MKQVPGDEIPLPRRRRRKKTRSIPRSSLHHPPGSRRKPIRDNSHALPCYYLTLKARKPRNPSYPEDLKTLGDPIRKRRLDLGMLQRDVAMLVNAITSTVTNWEKNRTAPCLSLLPGIFRFSGYNPLRWNTTGFGEKVRQYRNRTGLRLIKLAKVLDVDPGTFAKWERGCGESDVTNSKNVYLPS